AALEAIRAARNGGHGGGEQSSGAGFRGGDQFTPLAASTQQVDGQIHDLLADLELFRHGRLTVAVAIAAIPSTRPTNPKPSLVVALLLTCATCTPSMPAIRERIRSLHEPMRGASQSSVMSACTIAPPRSRTKEAACLRNTSEATPRQRASDGGKCTPISPSAMVPSSASVSACKATSASLWPISFFGCGMVTPHRITASPASKACTS